MKCSECQSDNPGGARFCSTCGAKLFKVCRECGLENLREDAHCAKCGKRLDEEIRPQGAETTTYAERKQAKAE